MVGQESHPIAAPLAYRVGSDADARQIADASVATWHEIDAALTPIIGQGGVAALYKRSLHLAAAVHPWLAGAHEGVQPAMDLAALKNVLRQQSSANAAAGASAGLQMFHELLATLVGPSLTERLLRSVWAKPLGSPPAQDTTPWTRK